MPLEQAFVFHTAAVVNANPRRWDRFPLLHFLDIQGETSCGVWSSSGDRDRKHIKKIGTRATWHILAELFVTQTWLTNLETTRCPPSVSNATVLGGDALFPELLIMHARSRTYEEVWSRATPTDSSPIGSPGTSCSRRHMLLQPVF